MIEVKIHKEISSYKEKWWIGFTLRQTICVFTAVLTIIGAVALWLFILGINPIQNSKLFILMFNRYKDLLMPVSLIIAFAVGLIGWFDINGMTFERFVMQYLRHLSAPAIRKYKNKNLYTYLKEEE